MDLLAKLEHALEGVVEGVFTRAFKTPLQPVEVAKRLSREMESHRSVSVNAIYVPNSYTVYLSRDTYQQFQEISTRLLSELEEYLREFVAEHNYQLVGAIAVRLAEDADLHGNEVEIAVTNEAIVTPSVPQTPSILRSAPPTMSASATKVPSHEPSADHTTVLPSPVVATRLEITSGESQGQKIALRAGLTIGRGPTNSLVLNEPGISRRHAEIVRSEVNWVVRDLNSTNGTFVNGKRITSQILRCGDVIKIGLTTLVVH